MDAHTREHLHETPWVVTGPLIVLAFFSVVSGYVIDPVVFGNFFDGVIHVSPEHGALAAVAEHYHGIVSFVGHAFMGWAIYLAIAGVALAWYMTLKNPDFADSMRRRFSAIYNVLVNKYYMDDFNQAVFAGGARGIGQLLWRVGDEVIIDGLLVNGSARLVGWTSGIVRKMQTGHLYTYAFSMIIGLVLMLYWFVFRATGAGA